MTTDPAAGAPRTTRPATEHWRPVAHFTTARSWLNDPNGLIHRDGTWHLFFQTNPHGGEWGDIGWGHATSTDLLTWIEQPVALLADEEEMVFSGSAVAVPLRDVGRVGAGDRLVAAYTSHYRGSSPRTGTQAQSLAVSDDEGSTWRRYKANPVLDLGLADFRDPKVLRFGGADGHWVMVVAFPHEHRVGIFTSEDLVHWQQSSSFGGDELTGNIWECPDLVRVPVRGGGHRWVALVSVFRGGPTGGSGVKYRTGAFDGRHFTPDPCAWRWVDHGHDYYAAATFTDAPGGRAVALAWAAAPAYAGQVPTAPWRGAMTLACDLELVPDDDGRPTLRRAPVLPAPGTPTAAALVVHDVTVTTTPASRTVVELRPADGSGRSRVRIVVDASTRSNGRRPGDGSGATLRVERVDCGPPGLGLAFASPATALLPRGATVDVRLVLDGHVLEIYADDGRVVLTELVFSSAPLTELVVSKNA